MSTNNENEKMSTEETVIINGVSYLTSDPYVVKDFFTNKYIHIVNTPNVLGSSFVESNPVNGIISTCTKYTADHSAFAKIKPKIMQYNLKKPDRFEYYKFVSEEYFQQWIKENDYVEGVNNKGRYYHKSKLQYDRIKPEYYNNYKRKFTVEELLGGYLGIDRQKRTTAEYKELENHVFKLNEQCGIESKSFRAFEGLRYTFGVEMETVTGRVNYKDVKDFNVSSVFDGSLRERDENGEQIRGTDPWGAEYVTGVLKGDSGLSHLHDIVKIISKNCTVDKRAALHVHVGSLKWNSEEIVYSYILNQMLQAEMFSMMPASRTNNEYCKCIPKLPIRLLSKLSKTMNKSVYKSTITSLYNHIFNIVGKNGNPSAHQNKKSNHPRGQHGGYDRDTDHRYSWINFTNIIFNQRRNLESKTIEYRIHSGTLSYKKIHNWIKICMAVTEFVHIGKKDIINAIISGKTITLEHIINKVYPKTGSKLISYIDLRKTLFSGVVNEDADYTKEESTIKNLKELICV